MRNKRAKAYRKLVGDVSADYKDTKTHMVNFATSRDKEADWNKVVNPIHLTDECGRAKYKTLKKNLQL